MPATLTTLLNRLSAKRLVAKRKGPVGKAFVYRPTGAPETTFRSVVKDVLQRVFHGDPIPLVASLFETRPPTREEVGQLEIMLARLKAEHRANEGGQE